MNDRPAGADRQEPPDRQGASSITPLRAWVLAARLHTLPAAAAPVLVGGGLAASEGGFGLLPGTGGFALLPFLAALAGALLIQIGTNFANDYHDFVKGADTEERRGFVRMTQAGIVAPERMRRWMIGAFGAAFVPGAYLVAVGGWPIVVIGLASIAAGVAYTGGPWPLGYHGLGELFVFAFFGLVAVAGTHYVQVLTFEPATLLAGTGVGALCTAILVVNNLRDRRTDARSGKRTLAVRLGVRGSRREYAALLLVAAAVPPAGVALLGWSGGALLALVAFGPLRKPFRAVRTFRHPERLNVALARTGRGLGLYGLFLAVGLCL